MKFSIRDLLLVTVIVALAVGWAVDRYRPGNRYLQLQLENDAMHRALRSEGWEVEREGWRVKIFRATNATKINYETWMEMPTSQAPAPNPPNP